MKTYLSPNGDEIVAVLVSTPGSCGIVGINDDGTPEYDGTGTEHYYDDQTFRTSGGKTLFLCDGGEEWTFDQLVPADEEDDEDQDEDWSCPNCSETLQDGSGTCITCGHTDEEDADA